MRRESANVAKNNATSTVHLNKRCHTYSERGPDSRSIYTLSSPFPPSRFDAALSVRSIKGLEKPESGGTAGLSECKCVERVNVCPKHRCPNHSNKSCHTHIRHVSFTAILPM